MMPENVASPLTIARRRDVNARRARVAQALEIMRTEGSEITISSVAIRARVHRSFIHRHLDLRADVYAAADQPSIDSRYRHRDYTPKPRSRQPEPAIHCPPTDPADRRPGSAPLGTPRRAGLLPNRTRSTPQPRRPRGTEPRTAKRHSGAASQAAGARRRARRRPGGEPPTHESTQQDGGRLGP